MSAAAVEAVTQHTSLCERMDSSDRRYLLLEELPEKLITRISSIVARTLILYIHPLSLDTYQDYYTSVEIPDINIVEYIKRIITYSSIDLCTLAHSITLIKHYLKGSDQRKLTEYNIHRLFATAIFISIRFIQDDSYGYEFFSKVFGIKKSNLKFLSLNFLFKINVTLHFPDELNQTYDLLKSKLLT